MTTGATLADTMKELVKTNPGYKWEVRQGVVELMPEGGLPELLKTRVGHFEIAPSTHKLDAFDVLTHISSLPGIKARATQLGMSTSGFIGCCGPGGGEDLAHAKDKDAPRQIRIGDVSLRDAFDSVVRAYGHFIWIYKESRCNGKTIYEVTVSWD